MKCTTADANYAVGDIYTHQIHDSASGQSGISMNWDATNINVRYAGGMTIFNKTTGAYTTATNASWRFRYYGED